MKRILLGILHLLLLPACGSRLASGVMDDVETYIQESPDSARRSLEALPARSHSLPWQRARFALLLSRALDRCGVSVKDDSLVRYAAGYYAVFGGPVHKYQTLYYLARVHENRGDRESAMEAFVKAQSIKSKKIPLRFRCATEMHMGVIYSHIYEFDRAIEAYSRAADYALKASWNLNYSTSVLNQARLFSNYGHYQKADSCFKLLQPYTPGMSDAEIVLLRGSEAKLRLSEGESSELLVPFVDSILSRYRHIPESIPWEDFAKVYVRSGQPEKAQEALQEYEKQNRVEGDAIYYSLLSEVLDSLGDLRGSLDAYKRYISVSDSLDITIFKQDTKFLKERHALQMQSKHRQINTWVALFASAAIISGLAGFLFKRRKERARLQGLLEDLKEEYHDLQNLPARQNALSQEASDLLGCRLKALAAFFSKDIPKSLSQISPQLETLAEDRKGLLETIGLLFAVYRPSFVMPLVEKGLTPAETGYCCLIALGIRNVEMKDVINREGVNNINSVIRRKLGIGLNTSKLGTVLREMFVNTGPA